MSLNSKFDRTLNPSLFLEERPFVNWNPPTPPSLDGIHNIFLNAETSGLQWWDKDRPISISLCLPDGSTFYIPWGHRGGGNLDEATCKRWAQRELRGKHITNFNTRFDVHFLRSWGVDLEEQGNTVSDVGHYAALLDDHRFKTNLDTLVREFLPDVVPVPRMDESRMVEYHAGEAAARSEFNVFAVRELRDVFWPMLDEQDLQRVRALEDKVIYPVCEMEKNGVLLDMELLDKWVKESEQSYLRCLWQIHRETGLNIDVNATADLTRLFVKLHLPITMTVGTIAHPKGQPSFTAVILKAIKHPVIDLVRRARKLSSLRSKYLLAFQKRVCSNGILRYALHQLRMTKGEGDDEGEAGTISGRFSSTEISKGVGVNVQQLTKKEKQRVSFGYNDKDDSHDEEIFIVRKLVIPESGKQWLASDMMQVEYRVFSSYAGNPKVLQAYRDDPFMDFHDYVLGLLKPFKPDLTRARCKDCSFAKIYGAGLKKLALMLNFITGEQFEMLTKQRAPRNHPLLAQALEIDRIYSRLLPEVGPLLKKASGLAETRGYVHTVLGRRARFEGGYRSHKAFNAVDQGSSADVMKTKLVELHEARKSTGFIMRVTVHDEVSGDTPNDECTRMVDQILNRQSFPQIKVPLLWETGVGENWASCQEISEMQFDRIQQVQKELGIDDRDRMQPEHER